MASNSIFLKRGYAAINIGQPLRTIIVEPLELPVNDPNPEHEPEHEPLEPEPEQVPASV